MLRRDGSDSPASCRLNRSRDFLLYPLLRFKDLYFFLLEQGGWRGTAALLGGLAAGWWIYVPIHELLHAAGCAAAGGEVHQLEIARLYGGSVLSRWFDFVVPGGEYAGRLSGFDTHGSDWIYGITVFFPYLLTIPAYAVLETAARFRYFFLFGAWLPCTFAPLISLAGDFYELGSLSVFQLWKGPESTHRALIGDDLFMLLGQTQFRVDGAGPHLGNAAFIAAAFLTGFALAWGTLLLSAALGRKARRTLF